ncbi:hypothetical protein WMY93_032957 [Mugilogobius chulae]|uniref:VWFA domain-containing protein n=1 Tax=Mugilogobius chulae TaxID=88201 RepID=A0AAW0MTB9_9GOBI
MELRALGIVSAVVSLRNAPEVQRILQVDDSGNSMFQLLGRNEEEDLRRIRSCAVCYDPCTPAEICSFVQDRPASLDLDLALVVDGSREVPQDEFQGFQELLGSVASQVQLSPAPQRPASGQVRLSLVQMSGATPTLEFGLSQYQNQEQVRGHVLQKLVQQRGASAVGQTLEFTLKEVRGGGETEGGERRRRERERERRERGASAVGQTLEFTLKEVRGERERGGGEREEGRREREKEREGGRGEREREEEETGRRRE